MQCAPRTKRVGDNKWLWQPCDADGFRFVVLLICCKIGEAVRWRIQQSMATASPLGACARVLCYAPPPIFTGGRLKQFLVT